MDKNIEIKTLVTHYHPIILLKDWMKTHGSPYYVMRRRGNDTLYLTQGTGDWGTREMFAFKVQDRIRELNRLLRRNCPDFGQFVTQGITCVRGQYGERVARIKIAYQPGTKNYAERWKWEN